MYRGKFNEPIEILLVEDNPGDVRLTLEAIKESKILCNMSTVEDGVEAIAFVRKQGKYIDAPQPDLLILDLNLPKKNGLEVLKEMKEDLRLQHIPVVMLTISESEEDILKAYKHHVNCYITKPVDMNQFIKIVNSIEDFWFSIVKLPKRKGGN